MENTIVFMIMSLPRLRDRPVRSPEPDAANRLPRACGDRPRESEFTQNPSTAPRACGIDPAIGDGNRPLARLPAVG